MSVTVTTSTAAMSRHESEVAMRDDKWIEDWREVIQDAEDCFWAAIAKGMPEATSGDLSPGDASAFTAACTNAARAWYLANVPERAVTTATCELRVIMRPPRKGERGYCVMATNAEAALAEILRESEELGWISPIDQPAGRDDDGMLHVTIEFAKAQAMTATSQHDLLVAQGFSADARLACPHDATELPSTVQAITLDLEIKGDQDAVANAIEAVLDSGVLQDAINEHDGVRVISAVAVS